MSKLLNKQVSVYITENEINLAFQFERERRTRECWLKDKKDVYREWGFCCEYRDNWRWNSRQDMSASLLLKRYVFGKLRADDVRKMRKLPVKVLE